MVELEIAIRALTENEVEFVVVGGVAITAYGSGYITQDFDFCYSRSSANLKKLAASLSSFNPRLRGFPENLPFIWDERTLQNGTNFTLETEIGHIDLLGKVAGVGDYASIRKSSQKLKICGIQVDVISLDDLINAKRAAARTKDLLVLPELEALRELLTDEE